MSKDAMAVRPTPASLGPGGLTPCRLSRDACRTDTHVGRLAAQVWLSYHHTYHLPGLNSY
jgi:hypothetical protein